MFGLEPCWLRIITWTFFSSFLKNVAVYVSLTFTLSLLSILILFSLLVPGGSSHRERNDGTQFGWTHASEAIFVPEPFWASWLCDYYSRYLITQMPTSTAYIFSTTCVAVALVPSMYILWLRTSYHSYLLRLGHDQLIKAMSGSRLKLLSLSSAVFR